MSNFFVNDKTYKDRLDICRDCPMLFKATMSCKRCGCFMRIKAKMSSMSCPDKKWLPTGKESASKDLPQVLIDECINIMPDLKGGKAKDQQTKKRMIELYNTIYNAHYKPTTSCPPCISTCYLGVKKVAENNNKNK
tara:strand:- start:262 stop:669 length:408 start_codon:yes stop_codon:yes gene_type:complete